MEVEKRQIEKNDMFTGRKSIPNVIKKITVITHACVLIKNTVSIPRKFNASP